MHHVLCLDMAEEVEKLLGTSYRKRRNHNISAPIKRLLHDSRKLCHMVFSLLMQASTVSRLHNRIIRLFYISRVANQRFVLISDISGEDDLLLNAILPHPDLNRGRAEQMTDIGKTDCDVII